MQEEKVSIAFLCFKVDMIDVLLKRMCSLKAHLLKALMANLTPK